MMKLKLGHRMPRHMNEHSAREAGSFALLFLLGLAGDPDFRGFRSVAACLQYANQ